MDHLRPYTGLFKQYAFVWKPEFSERHEGVYGSDAEAGRYVQPPRAPAPSKDQIIKKFVENKCQQELDRHFYRTRVVSKFLSSADLELLRTPVAAGIIGTVKPKALIDDRNDARGARNEAGGERRTSSGPLNARGFYTELSKPRVALQDHADAERRLIYITDLDPTCALALAATASPRQALFLRDFIYRYLACRTLIGVEIPFTGFSTFALEFHLPYYAWRRVQVIGNINDGCNEEEIDNNSISFRQNEEVLHLQLKGHDHSHILPEDGAKDYLHQAQISVMITGIDDWFWTGYCFADTHFKADGHNESVEHYANQRTQMDPFSCGKGDINLPIWLPRHYFLRTLSSRMEQVKQEWNNTVFQLFQQIDPCIYIFTRGETELKGLSDLEITQEPGFKWTIRVLRQFTHLLSKTIDAWETFKDGEVKYFNLPGSEALAQASWGKYLAAIDKDVIELRDLRSSVIHQTELFENMTNSIVTHAAHRETIATRLQSQFIQALTFITILYLPPTLASTIFSMPNSVLPGHARFRHWIYVFLGLSAITVLVVLNLSRMTKLGQAARDWQDRTWGRLYQKLVVDSWLPASWRAQDRDTPSDGIRLEYQARSNLHPRDDGV